MGGACCVASKNKTPSSITTKQFSEMNLRHLSSQSFQCVSHDEMNNHVGNHLQSSNQNNPNSMLEIKRSFDEETDIISDGGSHQVDLQTPIWQKSPASEETEVDDDRSSVSVVPVKGGCSHQVEAFLDKSIITEKSENNHFTTLSSIKGHPPPTDLIPSRQVRRSPAHRLLRQISGKVPLLKSSNGSGLSEERPSFVLSLCSSDLAQGSHGGSSDDWSMRAFSELVASSQKERLSFDSDFVGSFPSQLSSSPSSIHLLSCGICSRLLSETSWLSNEFSTTAVLTCGHFFHAECLEKITSEAEKFDPSCPVCTVGSSLKLSVVNFFRSESERKARNKISRIGIMDSEFEGTSSSRQSTSFENKGSKLGISSSMKNSLSKPFLRRYFSMGSKQSRATRKKGFGGRQ